MPVDYKKIRTLAQQGSFGIVALSENTSTGEKVIMKTVDTEEMDDDARKQAQDEIKKHKKLSHPNIVKLLDSYKTNKNKLVMITQYAEKLDLSHEINRRKKSDNKFFTEPEILRYFAQSCLGLKYLHDRQFCHRDIKPDNIFLTKNNIVKLGDLGVSKQMEFSEDMTSSKAGTSPYMSPECINGKPYNKQTDIWSLGVVLYELMTLQLPFVASTMRGVSKLIKKMNYTQVKDIVPEGLYSEELLALVERLMHPEQDKRPKMRDFVMTPIIWNTIGDMLMSDTYKAEFARQIGIKETKKGSSEKVQVRMFNKTLDDDIFDQISNQFIQGYQPEDDEVSPDYFAEQYSEYIAGMNKEKPNDYPVANSSSYDFETTPDFDTSWQQQSSVDYDSMIESQKSNRREQINTIMTGTWKSLNKEQLLDVGTLSQEDFDKFMIDNFQEVVYREGFQIVKDNLEQDKDEETSEAIQHLNFESTDHMDQFIQHCENFILQQNI